jgi:hypothetical protein
VSTSMLREAVGGYRRCTPYRAWVKIYEMRGPKSPSLCIGNNAARLAPLFVFSVSYHELNVPYTVHIQ